MKTAQPIRDKWYTVDISLWKYDKGSNVSYPEQVVTAIGRSPDTRITMNIIAASTIDVADIVWTLFAADDDTLQWSLNDVHLAGTLADYRQKFGVDGERDT